MYSLPIFFSLGIPLLKKDHTRQHQNRERVFKIIIYLD